MMLLAGLLALPVLVGLAVFRLPSARARMALLLATAVLHLAGCLAAWRVPCAPGTGAWLGLDALGLLVLTVTSVVFLTVTVAARAFLAAHEQRGERAFTGCLFGFLAAATLVAESQHLALMWIGMEATTLAMAPLVFHSRNRRSLEAVWKYLLLSSVGIGLALFGTFFLAAAQGEGRPLILRDLVLHAGSLQPALLRAAFVFLLVGYGTKMGLAPLHAWKPDTYGEAPAPVAARMAGAQTSCAFLGLARAVQVMAAAHQFEFARPPLLALGLASLVVSAGFMIGQADLRRLFAYSSVEHMGLLAIALGIGGVGAFGAALHVVGNGLIKTVMFLMAGNVVLLSKTSEAAATRGLLRRAPWTSALLVLGLFAVTGSPPFALFVSEFAVVGAAFHAGLGWLALLVVALFTVVFVAMARMLLRMVYTAPEPGAGVLAEGPALVAGPVVLTGLVLLLGLHVPGPLRAVLADAARSLGGLAP